MRDGARARAELLDEKLRVDVVRPDIVRISISRGGEFDTQPTYAVCVDPLADRVPFQIDRDESAVRLEDVSTRRHARLDPFRLDVHRSDGSVVVEDSTR